MSQEHLSKLIFNKHHIPVDFKPASTLRQKLVHPKDITPRRELNNVVSAVQRSQDCTDLYIGRQNNLSINEWHNTGGPTPSKILPLRTTM